MGFFFNNERTSERPTGPRKLIASPELRAKLGCSACPLNGAERTLKHAKMPPTGSKEPLLYVLGEAPGTDEDEQGEQFVGRSGRILRGDPGRDNGFLYADDMPDIRWNNAIRCHPPKNRDPQEMELACCMPKQLADIEQTRPRVVLCVGIQALQAIIGPDAKGGKLKMGAWRGRKIAWRFGEHVCWIVPTYHPAYILRLGNNRGQPQTANERREAEDITRFFERDIEMARQLAFYDDEEPRSVVWPEDIHKGVEILTKPKEIVAALDSFQPDPYLGTDIETNGLRPYRENPKILTAALSNFRRTIAFPIHHPEAQFNAIAVKQILDAYKRALVRCKRAWAHSLNFESEWYAWFFGDKFLYETELQDTMAQAFVLDERLGAMSLDALCRIYFGFSLKKLHSGLDMSRLEFEPLNDILPYNGLDAKFCSGLAREQAERVRREGVQEIYDNHRRRPRSTVVMQKLGMLPDFAAIDRFDAEFKTKVEKAEQEIQQDIDVRSYVKDQGVEFHPGAPKSVLKFFAWIGAHLDSTDESVLKDVDHPVAKLILEMREFKKLHSTYITPLKRDGKQIHHDGLIHTIFNSLLTTTGRLSSDSPNVQNFPRRKHKEIRNVIMAPPGYWLAALDYGQIEARCIGMASLDKFLMKALWEEYDIHQEWTERLAHRFPQLVGGRDMLHDKPALKKLRDLVKNQWTFPLFYLSTLHSVAKSFGVDHHDLRPEYDAFWQQFAGVKSWQERLLADYERTGYVESMTGRRRHGPMELPKIVNTPIQGVASDIVVDAMLRLSEHAVTTGKMHLHPRMNIHDDLTFYLPDESFEDDVEFIAKEMCRWTFDFINVPLSIEVSAGASWGDKQDLAKFKTQEFFDVTPTT